MAQEKPIDAAGEEPITVGIVPPNIPDEAVPEPPLYGMPGRNYSSPHVKLDAQMAAVAERIRREASQK